MKNALSNEKNIGSKNQPAYNPNSYIEKEYLFGHRPVPLKKSNKLSKSICKIIDKNSTEQKYGTGFFMIYESLKLLISNYHVISSNILNKNIEIEIWNEKKFSLKLDKKNRYIKLFEEPIDISIIEIKDSDGINKDIEYLNYDLNYITGFSQYKDLDVICIGYPFGKDLAPGSGTIIEINDYEFDHDIPTEKGSSGSPIVLFDTLKVIGIHKHGHKEKKNKCWNFYSNNI